MTRRTRPHFQRWAAVFACFAGVAPLLACGPEARDEPAESEGATGTSETASATGASPNCANIELPQGLPQEGKEPYWFWDNDVRSVHFMDPQINCGKPGIPDCPRDHPPGFVGYIVRLFPQQQAPGVYRVDDETVFGGHRVWIGAMFLAENMCELRTISIADHGVVEVLAIDDDCVAIDIRDVPPSSLGLDPNGSGRAMNCL